MQNDWAYNEFQYAKLWDNRCRRTLVNATQKMAVHPQTSLSRTLGSQRKAISRILHHQETTPQDLLAGHVVATRRRCLHQGQKQALILVASDTTLLDFTSHPATEGLGPIHTREKPRGFLLHSALALSKEGIPLGILHQQTWVRPGKQEEKYPDRDKESQKWLSALRAVEKALSPHPSIRVLMVQDREADVYSFLSAPRRKDVDLLIRATHPRRLSVSSDSNGTPQTLFLAMAQAPIVAHKSVIVRSHPNREGREAHLTVRQTSVLILPPKNLPQTGLLPVRLQVVRASEESPPAGVKEGVEWVLLTTLGLEGSESCLDLVEYYAHRWRIERFHYVLKSGCTFERLQLDSYETLSKALSLYSVISWHLLYLMYQAREVEEAQSEEAVSVIERRVLELATGKEIRTAREALAAVAWVGGIRPVPSAPTAGVMSLWIGYRQLSAMVEGYLLAHPSLGPPN